MPYYRTDYRGPGIKAKGLDIAPAPARLATRAGVDTAHLGSLRGELVERARQRALRMSNPLAAAPRRRARLARRKAQRSRRRGRYTRKRRR